MTVNVTGMSVVIGLLSGLDTLAAHAFGIPACSLPTPPHTMPARRPGWHSLGRGRFRVPDPSWAGAGDFEAMGVLLPYTRAHAS